MAMIIPKVFGDAVNARMGVKLRLAQLATDYTDFMDDIREYGDEVHFPTIDRISDASAVTKGTPIVPDEVSMSDAYATVKQVAKGVTIFDKDNVQVKGKLKERLAEQLGDALAKAVDADLASEILSADYKTPVTTLTASAINDAFAVFGDDIDNDTFAGIVINSLLRPTITAMPEFTSLDKTYNVEGNGVVKNGIIGVWNGSIPVIVSNNGTTYQDHPILAVVKVDALGIVWQVEPAIEEARQSRLLATDLIGSELYAAKLVHSDGASVLVVGTSTLNP